jgi:pimeloyl-ACP methyl ester carboxylesterase
MYYEYNDIGIYYEKYGNKDSNILILPGWGNTRSTFTNIINNLLDDYSIFILDYPSFGNSKNINKELTIYDYAELINNFIKDNNINNPIIIAHSFGGRITSLLVTKYKLKVDKIILIDVAGIKRRKKLKVYIKERIYKLLKKLSIFLPKIKKEAYIQKLLAVFASNDYKNIPRELQKTFQNIIREDLRKYYKQISNETLLIWGEDDKDTPLKDGIYLNKVIKNSALIVYKNSGHYSYLNNIYKTNLIIKSFIKK